MNECDVSLNCGSIQGDNKSTYSNVGNTFNISFKEGGYKQVIKPFPNEKLLLLLQNFPAPIPPRYILQRIG